jgi:hypothetical protein
MGVSKLMAEGNKVKLNPAMLPEGPWVSPCIAAARLVLQAYQRRAALRLQETLLQIQAVIASPEILLEKSVDFTLDLKFTDDLSVNFGPPLKFTDSLSVNFELPFILTD